MLGIVVAMAAAAHCPWNDWIPVVAAVVAAAAVIALSRDRAPRAEWLAVAWIACSALPDAGRGPAAAVWLVACVAIGTMGLLRGDRLTVHVAGGTSSIAAALTAAAIGADPFVIATGLAAAAIALTGSAAASGRTTARHGRPRRRGARSSDSRSER